MFYKIFNFKKKQKFCSVQVEFIEKSDFMGGKILNQTSWKQRKKKMNQLNNHFANIWIISLLIEKYILT